MVCPKCQSESVSTMPAEIRLYRNHGRSLSHPPFSPPPDVRVCADCGWAEFCIPRQWLSAGWLRPPSIDPRPSAVSAVPNTALHPSATQALPPAREAARATAEFAPAA